MTTCKVGYLGPPGTYSHLVAEKRFGKSCHLLPMPTILDACEFVAEGGERQAIVPIENSSGGAIYEMVDILLEGTIPVHITEELSLVVRLALLGHEGADIMRLYSHFAPLEHCGTWLRKHLPKARHEVVASTAVAAKLAAENPHAAALGSRRLGKMYNLDILHYPVEADVPNITVFLGIRERKTHEKTPPRSKKTTLAVKVPNEPGALCTFLEAFRDHDVNLSKLISRPIRGCPREYAFLVDIEGSPSAKKAQKALRLARKASVELRVIGSYPVRRAYQS